jgi:hypothetical protein
MKSFNSEMQEFLKSSGLPGLDKNRSDGWVHFLHLYAAVVEDCPLVMTPTNKSAGIASVTLHEELANRPVKDDIWYKVTWRILDKSGESGDIYVLNSFSLNPHRD